MTTGSEGRRRLTRLMDAFGSDGTLVVPKYDPGADGADLVPGSALRWPPCACGDPVLCPDYVPPESPTGT
ncbi:hypothetical protein [Streptomyces sp. SID3212]|uniref:hypothetical protein n=1 Tax=Streptomyces sp. SID3212 TaxID=2690259 RepID=UPI00136AA3F7|nr:hypothetical protein [Streptomyces sp. SID3212]MYV55594.1 hypothetical protein [Streptomyces sp. SID3212]